jgi:uncharacterized protein YggU (UPF0235/DUF167 family)
MKIQVRVHPKASKNKVISKPDGYIEVYTTLPPIKNLANQAVLEALAGYFNVPKSHIHLLKGRASRYKIFDLVK